jgi:23S rRNA (cytidine1920-2'-O)/16S rRNA (cytidine1409-2'-O)-methyltransferase
VDARHKAGHDVVYNRHLMNPRERADRLLVARGFYESRARAQAAIAAGLVTADGVLIRKASDAIFTTADIEAKPEHPYVSRGGIKLAAALDHFHLDVAGRICLDVGASTGGFTDCLLQRGAAHVTAIDTGFGQIAMKLRNDPRVRLMERTNARFLAAGSLAGSAPPAGEPTLLVMDVSFISATLLIGPVLAAAPAVREAVVLVKPQFEAGREHVGKGGIVRDPAAHQIAIARVTGCFESLAWNPVATIPSPITGAEGNQEFLLYARRNDP